VAHGVICRVLAWRIAPDDVRLPGQPLRMAAPTIAVLPGAKS
jgi:hypothetical protein